MKIDICLITESNLQSILEKRKNNRVEFSFRSWRKWSDMKITGYFTETTHSIQYSISLNAYIILYFRLLIVFLKRNAVFL